MKLPLLVMANPKTTREGPRVLLPDGNWKIEHNIKDSHVVLRSPDSIDVFDITVDNTYSGGCCNVCVLSPGTESNITIFAVQCP